MEFAKHLGIHTTPHLIKKPYTSKVHVNTSWLAMMDLRQHQSSKLVFYFDKLRLQEISDWRFLYHIHGTQEATLYQHLKKIDTSMLCFNPNVL